MKPEVSNAVVSGVHHSRGRIKIGSWTCPSGNSCDVTFERDSRGMGHCVLAWDSPPPLSPEDHAYYLNVVVPEIARRAELFGRKSNVTNQSSTRITAHLL